MKWEAINAEYYLKRILEQLENNNKKQDEIARLLQNINIRLIEECGSYEDVKKEEFKNILKKGTFNKEQLDVLHELADLFKSILDDKNAN